MPIKTEHPGDKPKTFYGGPQSGEFMEFVRRARKYLSSDYYLRFSCRSPGRLGEVRFVGENAVWIDQKGKGGFGSFIPDSRGDCWGIQVERHQVVSDTLWFNVGVYREIAEEVFAAALKTWQLNAERTGTWPPR